MNHGTYEVKNVKSFMGMEGYGFNANLYRGKKKIAFVIDSGNGGCLDIDWVDRDEEAILEAHINTLPKVTTEVGDLNVDADWFITDCVSEWERQRDIRKMKRQCETKILFHSSEHKRGVYGIINATYSTKLGDAIRKKYGNDIEIFNEVFADGKIPSVLGHE